MIINNKKLIQSYVLTAAKYDFSIYEKRILYRIIEVVQAKTNGLKLNYDYTINKDLFGDVEFTLPISCFMGDNDDDDKNHSRIKKALIDLRNKAFEYEDSEYWKYLGIIETPGIKKYDKNVTFKVTPLLMGAFLNFSKGYRKYELKTAMNFKHVSSMRFYELFSSEKELKPICYSIDKLKIMFGLEGKYKKNKDFIKRIVAPAKKELDAHSPVSFEYETKPLDNTGKWIRNTIKFIPFHQPQHKDSSLEKNELKKQSSLRFDFDKLTIDYLKQYYLFTDQEIKNNLELFKKAYDNPNFDLLKFMSVNKRKASEKKNPKGWIIGSVKKQLEQLGEYDVQGLLKKTFKKP